MSKQFWGVIIIVVLVLVGIFAFTGKKTTTGSNGALPTNHTIGAGTKHVTLVEYADYECPYCAEYYPTVKQVVDMYKQDITYQFRNFPITSLHQNAYAAARAAEAAGYQGKYFEMHDLLYQNQNLWAQSSAPQATFEQYAASLQLNIPKFRADYASIKVNNAINADMAAANKLGVTGTPSFFVDGKQVTIANNVDAFKKVLDAEIAKKNPSSAASSPSSSATPATNTAPPASTTPAAPANP